MVVSPTENMKSIGLTGATGFIGRHVVDALLEQNFHVRVLIHTSKDHFPKQVEKISGDLNTGKGLKKFLENLDCVVHLAARQLPPEEKMFQDNVIQTKVLTDYLSKSSVKHLINLSSVAVYGDSVEKKYTENSYCVPTTSYGLTKLLSEQLCLFWGTAYHRKVTILRPFNVYGQESKKGVVYSMIQSARVRKIITIYGDGKQKRDFLYVSDIVNALMLSIKSQRSGIFNLGTGINTSLLQLAEHIVRQFPYKVRIIHQKSESGKDKIIRYSIRKSQTELNWKAEVFLDKGIKKTIFHE